MMNEETIINGLKKIKKENSITEIIFHPTIDKSKTNNYKEFLITQNQSFKEELKKLDFELTNYTSLVQDFLQHQ